MTPSTMQPPVGPWALFFEPSGNTTELDRVLQVIRRHLGMDVALISRFYETHRVLEHVDCDGSGVLQVGQRIPLSQGYCQKISRGELPAFIPDTARIPAAMAIPETRTIPIGSHLCAPIVLADKRVFGALCCFSHRPIASLTERDMDALRAFADFLGVYFDGVAQREREKESATQEIRSALANDALRIVFQPVYELAQRRIHGFECLSRFEAEPRRSPDQWFNAAHGVGLGLELEMHACRKALDAQQDFSSRMVLNMNCSPELILSGHLLPMLAEGFDFSRVVLELTEHAVVNDYTALAEALQPFRDQGSRLAVDDAGAGYSSMRHILHLQPDFIKLDMSLTQTIDRDHHRKALAKGLISFAHEIGSWVVAEGVEEASELETLVALGVDCAQGYYLSKPLVREEAVRRSHAG